MDPPGAVERLRREVTAGRLEADAAEAVLVAIGLPRLRRRPQVAGLTSREVEVLRLLVRGLSHRDIAAELVVSPKTARNHIEHIYTKLGVSNRVGATLFALQHGIVSDSGGHAHEG